MPDLLQFDEINPWSEIKHDIVLTYARQYSQIMSRQPGLRHIYVDAFAGSGAYLSKDTGALVPGSALNAIRLEPRFREYHLIDVDSNKVELLKHRVGDDPDVHFYTEDGNTVLVSQIFPSLQRSKATRALCLLDPYGLHLDWDVVRTAGQLGTVEIFLNFPMMDMNRNVFRRDPSGVAPTDIARMNAFWGDESWRRIVYKTTPTLFDDIEVKTADNNAVAQAYRKRLVEIAGFKYVPDPLAMRQSTNSTVYYLFFATSNKAGFDIAQHLLKQQSRRVLDR